MDLIGARRRLLMQHESKAINTSPIIAEYDVHWNRTYGGKTSNADWCITSWYDIGSPNLPNLTLVGFIGDDATTHTFQYNAYNPYNQSTYTNFYYFANGNNEGTRRITTGNTGFYFKDIKITFSIAQSKLDDAYVYIQDTGTILFAGINSIYYGHKNISELN